MKMKSKLLLAATSLLTVSVAASATSAYAWIVANRQAFINLTNINVKSNASSLLIKAVEIPTDTIATPNDTSTDTSVDPLTLTSTVSITDISGDGLNFYKPTFYADNDPTKIQQTSKISNSEDVSTGKYYHEFKLQFSQTNNEATTAILISDLTTLFDHTSGDGSTGAAKSMRMAFLYPERTNPAYKNPSETPGVPQTLPEEVKWYYAPNRDSLDLEDDVYIKDAVVGSPSLDITKVVEGQNVVDLITTKYPTQILDKNFAAPSDQSELEGDFKNSKGYLGTLDSTTRTLDIIVRLWLEGTDPLCNNAVLAQRTDLKLRFDGYNAEATK